MKKIKLTNKIYSQLNEATPSANPNFKILIPDNVLPNLQENISREVYKDNTYIRVKMSKNFYDIITFPTACDELNRLVQFVDFPGYLKDLGDRLDSDPKKSIMKAPDYAVGAFMNTEFDIFKVKKKNNKDINDSLKYSENNILNEALPSMADIGATAGELGVAIGQGAVDAVSGFTNTVAPAVGNAIVTAAPTVGMGIGAAWGAGYGLGTMVGKMSSDQNPNRFTNDKQYFTNYDVPTENAVLKSDDPVAAIDFYLKNIQGVVLTLLAYITAPSARGEITDLKKTINTLSGNANKHLETFIKDNNDTLKEKERIRLDKELTNANREATLYRLKNDIYKILASPDNRNLNYEEYKKRIDKTSNDRSDLLRILDEISNRNTSESKKISKNLYKLNEDENIVSSDDTDYVIFNADPIYDEIKTTLSEKIIKILGTDPAEWESIKWARKEMDLMQEGADKEITAKIDIICRTANTDQMSAGAKLGAFIRKHPMRAEYLKGLWKRYMADLDVRKQKRLDNITNPNNASPMAMCISFLEDTYPSLVAMMITYKTIIKLINDTRLKNSFAEVGERKEVRNEIVAEQIKAIGERVEEIFASYGHLLATKDNNGKPIYDSKNHVFLVDGDALTRMGLFLSSFLPNGRNTLTKNNIKKYAEDILNIKRIIKANDIKSTLQFFNLFILFINWFGNINVLQNCDLIPKFTELNKNKDTLNTINILDNITGILNQNDLKTSFIERVKNYTASDADIDKFYYLIAIIRATKGGFITNYNNAKSAILNINPEDKDKITALRKNLHLTGDENAINDIIDDLQDRFTRSTDFLVFKENDSYILSEKLYYCLGLYDCKADNKFELVKSIIEILSTTFNLITILFEEDTELYNLNHFREEYVGTNGLVDAQALYDLVHNFTNLNKEKLETSQYSNYAISLDKLLKSENPLVPQSEQTLKKYNINTFEDIKKCFNSVPANVKSIEGLIKLFTKDTGLKDIDIVKASEVFKAYLAQIVKKFDNDFKNQNLDAFKEFIGNVKDSNKITILNIFVGYTTDNKPAYLTLAEVLATFKELIAYGSKDATIKSNLETTTKKIDDVLKNAFKQKTSTEITFNFMNIDDGIFAKLAEQDITPGNIKALVDTLSVNDNGTEYKASDNMQVKNSILNFIPDIFNLPIVTQFVNIMFGNENGKIYKYQQ